jgi:hypothetical protein
MNGARVPFIEGQEINNINVLAETINGLYKAEVI